MNRPKLDWRDIAERVIATICETAIAMIPVSAMIIDVDWKTIALTSATAGVLALLKAIAKAWGGPSDE